MTQVDLRLHGRQVHSVFRLLGDKENDLTYSLGWGLAKSPSLLKALIREVLPRASTFERFEVRLQHHGKDGGFTDIEIESSEVFIIIEAKLGWTLPKDDQLRRYLPRFRRHAARNKCLVTLSRCTKSYAAGELPESIQGIPVRHLSWDDLRRLSISARRSEDHAGKRLLIELSTFLGEVMETGSAQPNLAFCVSISTATPKKWRISWIDIIERKRSYFFPFNKKGWPKTPPTYVAFRYRGRLQSIHFIEKYEAVADMHSRIPEIPEERSRIASFVS